MEPDADSLTVHLARDLPAPQSHVYRMHIEPSQLRQWWGPRGFTVPHVELDVRAGGTYRITMQPPDGEPFVLTGEYLEVVAPSRLVYTFRWDDPDPDDRETVVSVALRAHGESTELIVDQRGFATEARRALHEEGWTESLERLERLITTDAPSTGE